MKKAEENKGRSDEEVSQLKDLLQEEKRKNEDLQFFLEEGSLELKKQKELLRKNFLQKNPK